MPKGRKPIYTPEEAKQRQRDRDKAWSQANTSLLHIRVTHKDKAKYAAFAEALGVPVATMFRMGAEMLMQGRGWMWSGDETDDGESGARADNGADDKTSTNCC